MSPFEDINGGQLSTDEIDALVAFIRSWEANPPADLSPQAPPANTPTPVAPAQQPSSGTPGSFSEQVLPIFQANMRSAITHRQPSVDGMQPPMNQQ